MTQCHLEGSTNKKTEILRVVKAPLLICFQFFLIFLGDEIHR